MSNSTKFHDALKTHGRWFYPSVASVYEREKEICDWMLTPLATWAEAVYGEEVFEVAAKGYAEYCLSVSKAQRAYEETGVFNPSDVGAITREIYHEKAIMTPYMWAAVLIYPFWPSMINHLFLFRDHFLDSLPENPRIVELGCGHGVVGMLAAAHRRDATLIGYDISPGAIEIATALRGETGFGERARFEVRDVLELGSFADTPEDKFHGVIAAMLAEHLEDPRPLFASIRGALRPGGLAFVSTAIESAQDDHVYEFHHESEPAKMAEDVGLRVRRMVSDRGSAIAGGRYIPRAVAMVLECPE